MAKTFKRIAALATAIALVVCFAVSASAINVATTTQYAATAGNVNVTVRVTEGGNGYVTYYATKDSTPVFIEQEALVGGNATIQYQTAETNLKGTVKVGYTGNTGSAETKAIDAYTIKYNGGSEIIPTGETRKTSATITMAYTASENKKFDTVTVDDNTKATVTSATETNGTITVVLASITGDVTLTVVEQAETAPDAKVTFLDAAAIKVKADHDAGSEYNEATEGNRKFTVIGQFTGTADEFGVAVSTEKITEANIASATKYAALGANDIGVFAVQLIDEGTDAEGAVIYSGSSYYVAIYAKLKNGDYVIAAGAEAVPVKQ
jgi:hypothetical protein